MMDTSRLDDLDVDALSALIEFHKEIARELVGTLERKRAAIEHERQRRRDLDRSVLAADFALTLVRGGLSFDAAVNRAAHRHTRPADQVRALAVQKLKERTPFAREVRKAAVIRFVMANYTNDEIAARLDIHRNTVSRDIQAAYRVLREGSA